MAMRPQRIRQQRKHRKMLFDQLARNETEYKGRCTSCSTAARRRKALLSQGGHEAEISFEGVSDLHESFVMCTKNKNHNNFIPAGKFCLQSLPREYQETDIFDCVMMLINLSVIIKVSYTSENRPKGYDFSEQRGNHASFHDRWGSGSVFLPRKRKKCKSCPCSACKSSSEPSKSWHFVWVSTAHHVVYDDLEAKQAMVGMFYNDSRDSIKWLQGIRLVNFNPESDRCILECITHDDDICRVIRDSRSLLKDKETKLNLKYAEEMARKGQPLMTVLVSHPHGCDKQVSIGTRIIKKRVRNNCEDVEWTEYFYDTPSCRGCSGSLVWIMGQARVGYRDRLITTHTHTGFYKGKMNKSSGGLDFVARRKPPTPVMGLPIVSHLESRFHYQVIHNHVLCLHRVLPLLLLLVVLMFYF